jgi:hypothetical protein
MFDCSFSDLPTDLVIVVTWSIFNLKGKELKASLGKLCLRTCVYHLWQQKNALMHNNNPKTEEAIVKQIKWEVRTRILGKGSFKSLEKHLMLVIRWNLHKLLSGLFV